MLVVLVKMGMICEVLVMVFVVIMQITMVFVFFS